MAEEVNNQNIYFNSCVFGNFIIVKQLYKSALEFGGDKELDKLNDEYG